MRLLLLALALSSACAVTAQPELVGVLSSAAKKALATASRMKECSKDWDACKDNLQEWGHSAVQWTAQKYVNFIDDKAPQIACVAGVMQDYAEQHSDSQIVQCMTSAAANKSSMLCD